MSRQRIAVIGAGPAGAAAANGLTQRGHDVTVYERSAQIGGRTFTYRDGGDLLDTGAGFITNFYPRVWALAENKGFADHIKELNRITGLHTQGHLAYMNIGSLVSFLKFPFMGLREKMKMAAWTGGLTLKRGRYDIANPETLVDLDHRSIGDLAREELTEGIYHTLIRPGVEPFWYFHCEDVSAALVEGLTAHAAGAKFYYVSGGIDQICTHLLTNVPLVLNAEVTQITQTDQGLRVVGSCADGELNEVFDRVVIATTATVADGLTKTLPETVVTAGQRAFLSTQEYAANVHICYRVPRLENPPKLNAIFPCGPGRHALAALSFHRPKSDPSDDKETELISVYLSDPESLRVMDWSDEALHDHGLSLGRTVYPDLPQSGEIFHISRRREAIPVHGVGRYRGAVAFQADQTGGDRSVQFCGDYLATSTVDGAIATGLTVVETIGDGDT
jgi:protoporphyrinogen/coproporphyrinogen III oxidase